MFRGIPADVWVAENVLIENGTAANYQTTELYFSPQEWKVLVDEVNTHKTLPLGMATFIASSVCVVATNTHKDKSIYSSL